MLFGLFLYYRSGYVAIHKRGSDRDAMRRYGKAASKARSKAADKGLRSNVRAPLHCKVIVDPANFRRELAQARRRPQYGVAMPPTAADSRVSLPFSPSKPIQAGSAAHGNKPPFPVLASTAARTGERRRELGGLAANTWCLPTSVPGKVVPWTGHSLGPPS